MKSLLRRESVEADVLCIGGGIAGLMAAIRARELGAKVIVAEKGNSRRSGNAATGIDHMRSYIPEVHGPDVGVIVESLQKSQHGGLRPKNFMKTWMENTFQILLLWEKWGIPIKYQGRYDFQGHCLPGDPMWVLHICGQDLKVVLTREALKRGAQIMNRVMIHEVFNDGSVTGALGIDTREDKILEFKAKSIILGTGSCTRLYPGPTPGWMVNLRTSPACTGDGRAMAFRAGAELVNMEQTVVRCGTKYFARAGKGTWAGVVRDPQGKPVGSYVSKPNAKYGEPVVDFMQGVFRQYDLAGKGPLYMDCRGVSDADYEYMRYFMRHEGLSAFLDYLDEEGIDVRKNPIEFTTYNDFYLSGGIRFNERGETSIKGLYAAGDEFGGGGSAAAVFGWLAGENAAGYSQVTGFGDLERQRTVIEEKCDLLNEMRGRRSGATWKEANLALQQVMNDYAGFIRSEALLDAGLAYLGRIREKVRTTLMAANPHELMRCLEVLNLLDVGELVCIAANERKETRRQHVRSDYPIINPLMEKQLILKNVKGKPASEWREIEKD